MLSVELQEENAQLAQLISLAAETGPIIIAVAGKPLAKLVALIEPDDSAENDWDFLGDRCLSPKNLIKWAAMSSLPYLALPNESTSRYTSPALGSWPSRSAQPNMPQAHCKSGEPAVF